MRKSEAFHFNSRRRLLGCFLLAGDPQGLPNQTQIYYEAGVDFIEFGLPSDDPFLDGAVISAAHARAWTAGIDLPFIRRQLIATRDAFPNRPVVIVSYGDYDLSLLDRDGKSPLFEAHLNLGELPATAQCPRPAESRSDASPRVGFVSHEVTAAEIDYAKGACGYVFLQASPGKTGAVSKMDDSNIDKIRLLRSSGITLPIVLGFGISTIDQVAAAVEMGAEGVIIGSQCLLEAEKGEDALRGFLSQVRDELDHGK